MAALLATTALVAAAALLPGAARAQDATWAATPGSGDFNTAANWTPAAVPAGTAFFDMSNTTSLSSSTSTAIGGWTFNAGASAYTFTNGQVLQFTGAGIVINGGSASITNNSVLNFNNTSTAGGASITNSFALNFNDTSTAGSASITNNRVLTFLGTSTAGSATITSFGNTFIEGSASGGTARFILIRPGNLDLSGLATGTSTTAGSIEGTGGVFLGSNNLAVGGNNLSTTFSGVIQDGSLVGGAGGTGGSLTKTGSGTLTLSGANTYTGGTTVEAGTLRAGGAGAFVGNTAYAVNGGTLDLNGFNLTMSSLSGTGGTVALGAAALTIDQATDTSYAGAVTGTGSLTKAGTGTLTLSGANTYTGATTVTGGTLAVNGSIASSSITDNGNLVFGGTSTAGSASITDNSALTFHNTSTAGSASITNSRFLTFLDTSTAGSATITDNGLTVGGTFIEGSASGGTARFILNGTGNLDLSGLATGTSTTAGSIEGAGRVFLGSHNLSVGGNNLSTTFSGVIQDGGFLHGTGGSLTKTGTGTLTLSGVNTYTGGTTVEAGTLAISADHNLGANTGGITFNGGTLQFGASFDLANTRAITLNAGGGTFDTNGFNTTLSQAIAGTGGALTKTGSGTLTLSGANTYTGGTTVEAGTLRAGGAGAFVGNTAYAVNGGTLDLNGFNLTITSLSGTGGTVALGAAALAIDQATDTSYAGAITGTGSLTKAGTGTLTLSGANTYTGGTTIDGGTLQLGNGGTSGSIVGDVADRGVLAFNRADAVTFGGMISGTGAVNQLGPGTTTLSGANTYTGGTTISAGTLQLGNGGTSGSIVGDVADRGVLAFNRSDAVTFGGVISGTGAVNQTGSGTTTLTGANTYTGATNVGAGLLQAGAANTFAPSSAFAVAGGATLDLNNFNQIIGSLAGTGGVTFGSASLTAGGDNTSTIYSGIMSGTGGFNKTGSGKLILSGINSYTGATVIDGGILSVNGDITASNGVTVNAGGTLGGNGVVGNTTVSGGMLAPGNSIGLLTVQGNLTFTAASSYMVEVSPSNADRTNVMGTATLGNATVNASFAPGTFVAKQYTILNAAGGVSGGFNGPVNTNLPANFRSSLSYDTNDVFLNLALAFVAPPGTGPSGNQQSVGNTITAFFNSNGSISMVFGGLTSGGLSQISGETATGTQQTTFDAMNLFMGVLTDPFIAGRGDGVSSSSGAPQFADENDYASAYADRGKPRTKSERDAYAAIYRKAPPMAGTFAQRWSVWTAGFGGSQTTDGNAALGSNTATSSVAGTAVGADYRFSPDTLAGFALAGGGTNFSVNGAGSGRSDLFQAGAFIRHNIGAAYLTGALAYGWQDVTTDHTITVAGADHLRAEFNANAWSGRVEGGYRFVSPWGGGIGITPYAAGQFTTLDLPAYAESALAGTNTFALVYGSKSVTDTRSELGIRTDKSFAMQDSILILRGRFAWAHDFNPDRNIAATFQTLPGASFVVNGAAQASDSALTTASAELKWRDGWSAAATFEGEFSDVTRSYAGKGVVRYAW